MFRTARSATLATWATTSCPLAPTAATRATPAPRSLRRASPRATRASWASCSCFPDRRPAPNARRGPTAPTRRPSCPAPPTSTARRGLSVRRSAPPCTHRTRTDASPRPSCSPSSLAQSLVRRHLTVGPALPDPCPPTFPRREREACLERARDVGGARCCCCCGRGRGEGEGCILTPVALVLSLGGRRMPAHVLHSHVCLPPLPPHGACSGNAPVVAAGLSPIPAVCTCPDRGVTAAARARSEQASSVQRALASPHKAPASM